MVLIKIGFILLCHEQPSHIEKLLKLPFFRSPDVKLYVHFDANASIYQYRDLALQELSLDNVNVLDDRVVCRWGEYSLVDATLRAIEYGLDDKHFRADYFYLISGSCFPIKPLSSLQKFLLNNPFYDFIEAVDPAIGKWAVGGHELERVRRHYPFNFQKQRLRFEAFTKFQKLLKISRRMPEGFKLRFGSQWFCIRRESAVDVTEYLRQDRIRKFLKHSWIPDEFAIQSAIATVGDEHEISKETLTYYEFRSDGKPLILYDDHERHLLRQPHFFARKRSQRADLLLEAFSQATPTDHRPRSRVSKSMTPTGHFRLHQKLLSGSSAIGNVKSETYNPMDLNRKDYWVVTGTSRDYIRAVMRTIRSWRQHCAYDYLFDKNMLVPAHERSSFEGFSEKDLARRNYNPRSFLYEVVQNNDHNVLFALDPTDIPEVIEHVRRDRRARVIVVEPPVGDLTKRRILRLSDGDIPAFMGFESADIRDGVHAFFAQGHTGLSDVWLADTLPKKASPAQPTLCTIDNLETAMGGVADCVRAACESIKIEDIYSTEHLDLLRKI